MSSLGWRGIKHAFEKLITGPWGGETSSLHLLFTKNRWIMNNIKASQPWSWRKRWILDRIWEAAAHRSQRECDSLKGSGNKWGPKRKGLGHRLKHLPLRQGPLGCSWPPTHHYPRPASDCLPFLLLFGVFLIVGSSLLPDTLRYFLLHVWPVTVDSWHHLPPSLLSLPPQFILTWWSDPSSYVAALSY